MFVVAGGETAERPNNTIPKKDIWSIYSIPKLVWTKIGCKTMYLCCTDSKTFLIVTLAT